jgi:hypothetical protein
MQGGMKIKDNNPKVVSEGLVQHHISINYTCCLLQNYDNTDHCTSLARWMSGMQATHTLGHVLSPFGLLPVCTPRFKILLKRRLNSTNMLKITVRI